MLIDAPPTLLNTIIHKKHLSHFMAKGMNELAHKSPLILSSTSVVQVSGATLYYVVQPCCYAVQICCSVALKPYSIPATCRRQGLGTKANSISRWQQVCFSFHSFVNFHGTYGSQTENNVNIF